jgi:hypothetical protein
MINYQSLLYKTMGFFPKHNGIFYYHIIIALEYIVTVLKVFTIYLKFISSVILFYPPSPLLRMFQQSHFSIFIHEYIIFLPYSPPASFTYILPCPTGTTPQTRPVLPSCPLFLKKDVLVCLK